MHFCILLLHASIHSWEDSSGIALNSFVTILLMVIESWKWVLFYTPLDLGKRKKSQGLNPVNKVVVPAWQCYFWPKIPGCSRHCEQEQYRDGAAMTHSQIFRDNPPHSLTIHVQYSSVFIRTGRRRSLQTFSVTSWIFSLVLLVDGLPLLESTSFPSWNLLCHSNIQNLDIVASP